MASPLTNLWRWLNQPIYDERNLPANLFGIAVEGSDSTDTAGVTVDQDTAMRLSAVWSAIRLLSHDIGSLPIDPYRKRAGRREVIDPPPSWIDLPIVRDPSVTSVDHFSQVVAGMLRDGNDFTLAFPSVVNPAELHILEPEKVEISRKADGEPVYKDHDSGKVFSPDQIIHIPLFRKPGALRGMSPIEAMKTGIGRGMAAEEMGSRFFSRGSQLGGVVEYPLEAGEVKKEQVQELLRGLNKRHRGIRNAWALGALTQGAKFHELQMKPSDSQLIETEEWTLEQIARAYGVPPSMLGSQKPGAVAYASVEQRSIDYVVHGVLPITIRIEKAYSRLLPRGSYIKFNVGGLLRGDARSRWEQYQIALQNKVMTRDEVRILEDMEPVGGADGDFLETPNNNAPADPTSNAQDAARMFRGLTINPPTVNITQSPITVEPADVHVTVPERSVTVETPAVTVEPTSITVEPADVRVEVPVVVNEREQPTPQIDVHVEQRAADGPAEVIVTKLPDRIHHARRSADGRIDSSIETDLKE